MARSTRSDAVGRACAAAFGVALVLVWLNPFIVGPSTMAWSILVALPAWVLLCLTPAEARARTLAWAVGVAAIVSAAIGLAQRAGVAGALTPWVSASPGWEAYGNLRQRNQFASLMVMGCVVWLWWARGANVARTGPVPYAWAGGWALLVAATAASNSRTGLVALVLVCAFVALRWRSASGWQRLLAASALPIYGVCAWMLSWDQHGSALARLSGTAQEFSAAPACSARTVLWRNVLHLIAQKPWTGWGWGELDWAHFTTLYDGPRFCDLLDNAHNLPLHLAVELGLPAAALILGAVACATWRARPWAERQPDRLLAWGFIAVIALHSAVEYPLWYGCFQVTLMAALALLWDTRPDATTADDARWVGTAQPVGMSRWGLAAALALGGAYATYDYLRVSQIYTDPGQRWPSYRVDPITPARDTRLFGGLVDFAQLTLMPVSRDNAAAQLPLAERTLHYSPESQVVQRLIDAARLTGDEAKARWYEQRYAAAYPDAHATWRRGQAAP